MLMYRDGIDGRGEGYHKAERNETATTELSSDSRPTSEPEANAEHPFPEAQAPTSDFGYEGFSRKLISIARSPMRCYAPNR